MSVFCRTIGIDSLVLQTKQLNTFQLSFPSLDISHEKN